MTTTMRVVMLLAAFGGAFTAAVVAVLIAGVVQQIRSTRDALRGGPR